MKEKALFLVNTPYQLMVAINMCFHEFSDCDCDVVISDRINDFRTLAKRVAKQKIFVDIFCMELNKLYPQNNKIAAVIHAVIPKRSILLKHYNYFLFANLNYDASCIYRIIRRRNNKINVYMFEDGYASYSQYYADYFKMLTGVCSVGKRLFHKLVDSVLYSVERMYVFLPEIFTYKSYFNIVKLSPIDYMDFNLIECYNKVFGYSEDVDKYSSQYIFFEESYYADGCPTNDIEIVGQLANIVGKENIFVKIHPRNPVNRFAELGYATNRNTVIPWEVIAMNLNLENKILITISSVAVIVPKIMFSKKYRGILLMDMMTDDSCLKKNITSLYYDICNHYEDLYIPQNTEELTKLL